MKHYFFLILLMAGITQSNISAQSKLNFGVKSGLLWGNLLIATNNNQLTEVNSYRDEPNLLFALSGTWPISPKFRIGAEIGQVTFNHFFINNITENGEQSTYDGRYSIQQFFVAVTPEWRLNHWFYVNAGVGLYADSKSYFRYGQQTTGTQAAQNLAGTSFKRNLPLGGFIGAGLCPNITDELALILESRFMASPATVKSGSNLGIGYSAFNFNLGFLFKIRGSKE